MAGCQDDNPHKCTQEPWLCSVHECDESKFQNMLHELWQKMGGGDGKTVLFGVTNHPLPKNMQLPGSMQMHRVSKDDSPKNRKSTRCSPKSVSSPEPSDELSTLLKEIDFLRGKNRVLKKAQGIEQDAYGGSASELLIRRLQEQIDALKKRQKQMDDIEHEVKQELAHRPILMNGKKKVHWYDETVCEPSDFSDSQCHEADARMEQEIISRKIKELQSDVSCMVKKGPKCVNLRIEELPQRTNGCKSPRKCSPRNSQRFRDDIGLRGNSNSNKHEVQRVSKLERESDEKNRRIQALMEEIEYLRRNKSRDGEAKRGYRDLEDSSRDSETVDSTLEIPPRIHPRQRRSFLPRGPRRGERPRSISSIDSSTESDEESMARKVKRKAEQARIVNEEELQSRIKSALKREGMRKNKRKQMMLKHRHLQDSMGPKRRAGRGRR